MHRDASWLNQVHNEQHWMLLSQFESSINSKLVFNFKTPLALPQKLFPCLTFMTKKCRFFHIHIALPSDACDFQENWGVGSQCSKWVFQKIEKLKECFVKVASDWSRSSEQKILLTLSCGSNGCLQNTYLCMSQDYCIQLVVCEDRKESKA